MGLDARKPVFGGLRTKKAQSDQRLCFSLFEKYHIETCNKRNFSFLASLCSRGDCFESCLVGNNEYRFSCDAAQMSCTVVICLGL